MVAAVRAVTPLTPFGATITVRAELLLLLALGAWWKVTGGETVTATFNVTNTGKVAGADVPHVYLTEAPDGWRTRLLGFERVELRPGESKTVTAKADPRLLARFDGKNGLGQWRIAEGTISRRAH